MGIWPRSPICRQMNDTRRCLRCTPASLRGTWRRWRRSRTKVPDGRTVKQVVGHIAEWERYVILSAGEMLAGVTWPGLMSHSRYVEPDGSEFPFRNDDEFNARQAEKYAAKPWAQTRELAIHTASACHRLWVRSGLLGPELLERTRLWQHYRLPTGVTLSMPCGWFLWMITIEHEGVEHVSDLELGRGA